MLIVDVRGLGDRNDPLREFERAEKLRWLRRGRNRKWRKQRWEPNGSWGLTPATLRSSLASPPSPGPPSKCGARSCRRTAAPPGAWGAEVQIWERRAGRGISSGDLRSSALHCDAENNIRGRESLSATHRPQMPHDATFAAYAFLRQSGLLTAATPQKPQRRKSRNAAPAADDDAIRP